MAHWLCIVNKTNWSLVERKRLWGVNDRHAKVLAQVKLGDSLVFYVKLLAEIPGIYEAAGNPFESNECIFDGTGFDENEVFKHRLRIRERLKPPKSIDFKTLVPVLDLFPKKKVWMVYLRGKAMMPLTNRDYETIREKLARSV